MLGHTFFAHTRTQTYLFVPLSLINFIPLRNNFSSRETAIEQQSSRRTTTRTLDRERRRRREVLKRACRREIGFRFTFSLLEFLSLSLSISLSRAQNRFKARTRTRKENIVVTLSVVVVVVLQQIVKKCGNWSARNQIWMPRRNCTR